MANLKTKVVVAYEKQSTETIRLTPVDIGELLAQMKPRQFEECMCKFTNDIDVFRKSDKPCFMNILKGIVKSDSYRKMQRVLFKK